MSSAPYWTAAEDTLLRERYPTATNAELQALFPTRPLGGIRQRAHQIGVHKNIEAHERGMPFDGSVIGHLSEAEKGYLAGIIDGEGHIGLSRRPENMVRLFITSVLLLPTRAWRCIIGLSSDCPALAM
jgi:hypothetical protein